MTFRPRLAVAPVRLAAAALALALALAPAPAADAAVLYDGALGTTPGRQGWLFLTTPPFGAQSTEVALGGVTVLDSTPDRSEHAGYFASFPALGHRHPQLPVLDRTAGYSVAFEVRVDAEGHASDDRAGLSVIVLSEDLKGLEIGFWPDQVWVQADQPVFTHAEGAPVDTTAAPVRYELCVAGDDYSLRAGGVPVLAGRLRDYAANYDCSCCPPGFCPYLFPSFVFVGDDTTSADARIELARVEVAALGAGAGAVGNTLTVVKSGADLLLAATPSGSAAEYRLYRDADPAAVGRTLDQRSPEPRFTDSRALGEPGALFFAMTAADACGGESP